MEKRVEIWLVLQLAVSFAILFVAPYTHFQLSISLRIFGGFLLFVGLILSIFSFIQLGPSFTLFVKPIRHGNLVISGVYSIIRHPMYSALVLFAFGWSLVWGTLAGIVLSFFFFFILDRKASAEEKLLIEKYPEYADYKARVKKFIPLIY